MAISPTLKTVRTEAEMFPLVERWLESSMTQQAFSLKHQLSPHILPYWINRYRQQKGQVPSNRSQAASSPQSSGFIQVGSSVSSAASTANELETTMAHGLSIELPSGLVLRFPSLIPASYLQEVIAACSH